MNHVSGGGGLPPEQIWNKETVGDGKVVKKRFQEQGDMNYGPFRNRGYEL